MKFSINWGKRSRIRRESTIIGSRDFEEFTLAEQMQVLPYMIDAPPRRGLHTLLPRQRMCFFSRQRHHVVPTTDLPPYETMLRLDDKNPKRAVKASVLSKLPVVQPSKEEAAEGCLVCLDKFHDGLAKRMPCSHLFCKKCLSLWLCNNRSCPVCRFEFPDGDTHLIIPK